MQLWEEELKCPSWNWEWLHNVRGQPIQRSLSSNYTFCDGLISTLADYTTYFRLQALEEFTVCKADQFYIPSSFMTRYNVYASLSVQHQSFLEVAVPTFIQMLSGGLSHRFCSPPLNLSSTSCFLTHALKISLHQQVDVAEAVREHCQGTFVVSGTTFMTSHIPLYYGFPTTVREGL